MAFPYPGYVFDHWSGSDGVQEPDRDDTYVQMLSNIGLTAHFVPVPTPSPFITVEPPLITPAPEDETPAPTGTANPFDVPTVEPAPCITPGPPPVDLSLNPENPFDPYPAHAVITLSPDTQIPIYFGSYLPVRKEIYNTYKKGVFYA
jgi:hypothetical protein